MQTSRIGKSREKSATCSIRSRNVDSAQWRSSTTTTSGPARASASNSLRTAQTVSSLVPRPAPPSPSAPVTRSAISPAFSSPASRAPITAARLLAGVQSLRARDLPDDLGQRPIGDALAIGQTAAAQDRDILGKVARELPYEPRLSHTRVAENGDQVAGPVADRIVGRRSRARLVGVRARRKASRSGAQGRGRGRGLLPRRGRGWSRRA